MADQIKSDEIQQVLHYIDNIREYDKRSEQRLYSINEIVWSLMFFYGGLMDFLLHYLGHSAFVVFPWLMSSIGGGILAIFITRNRQDEIITDEVQASMKQFNRMNRVLFFLVILGWVATSIIALFELYWLITPYICFMIGTNIIVFTKINMSGQQGDIPSLTTMIYPSSRILFTGFLAYLASIVNLSGFFLLGWSFQPFMGLIMGVLIGVGFLNSGIRTRNL